MLESSLWDQCLGSRGKPEGGQTYLVRPLLNRDGTRQQRTLSLELLVLPFAEIPEKLGPAGGSQQEAPGIWPGYAESLLGVISSAELI